MTFTSMNPANGTLIRSYDALCAETVISRIADAQSAFGRYSETPLDDRVMWMKKLAGILEQEMEELATLLTTEMGMTIRASREEVLQCAACCRYYAENATTLLEEEAVEIDSNRCITTWLPMGVLLAVMPSSSSPFWQVFRFAVPALLGGNTVMLRHSDHVPQCALELELLLRRAGFARGVFQTLLMDDSNLEITLNDERIAGVAIAGVRQEARELAAHAAWMGKKTVVDQPGGHAFIVMPSANVFAAIQAGVASRCVDNGQSNASAGRFIVHEDVYDDFSMLFVAAMEDVKVGNPLKDETELGPLTTEERAIRLKAQVEAAVAAGGRVMTGGEPMLGDGHYFEPTVIVDMARDANVCREEVHGPVALLFKVGSLQEAAALANAVPTLGVSVWTQDEEEQRQLSRKLMCGSVYLNATASTDRWMLAGAMTQAGCGRTMATTALREFMRARTIVTTDVVAGEEFNFDLTLNEFEHDAQVANTEANQQVMNSEVFGLEELDVDDDLLVLSQAAGMAEGATNVPTHKTAEMSGDLLAVSVLDEPEMKAVAVEAVVAPSRVAELPAVVLESEAAVAVAQPAVPSFKEMFERALLVRA